MSIYSDMIRDILAKMGRIGTDPRHVEAYMRLEHSTLDGLQSFSGSVRAAVRAMDEEGMTGADLDHLAASYGLMPRPDTCPDCGAAGWRADMADHGRCTKCEHAEIVS